MRLGREQSQPDHSLDDVGVPLVPQGAADNGAGLADAVQLAVDRRVPEKVIKLSPCYSVWPSMIFCCE